MMHLEEVKEYEFDLTKTPIKSYNLVLIVILILMN